MSPQPGARLPAVSLPNGSGGTVALSAFRGRLSLALFLAGDGAARAGLSALAALEPELRQWGAETLLIAALPADQAATLDQELAFAGRVLLDPDGALHSRLGAIGPDDRPAPALLIADRSGEIRFRLRPDANADALSAADREEAIGWARYLGIQEPECGTCVPAWPAEWMDDVDTSDT